MTVELLTELANECLVALSSLLGLATGLLFWWFVLKD